MTNKEEIQQAIDATTAQIETLLQALIEVNEPENITAVAISISKMVSMREAFKMTLEMVTENEQTTIPDSQDN